MSNSTNKLKKKFGGTLHPNPLGWALPPDPLSLYSDSHLYSVLLKNTPLEYKRESTVVRSDHDARLKNNIVDLSTSESSPRLTTQLRKETKKTRSTQKKEKNERKSERLNAWKFNARLPRFTSLDFLTAEYKKPKPEHIESHKLENLQELKQASIFEHSRPIPS